MRRFAIISLVLLAFAAPAAAQLFDGVRNSLFQFALDQISVPGEMELAAEGVESAEDGATEIVGLTVGDGEGVWLTVERVSLRWNASRIVGGELEIERLAAIGVEVLRAPASSAVAVEVKEDAAIAETDDDPFDWPRAPIAVRVDDLRAERVRIAPGVIAAQGLAFDAVGALRDEGDEQALSLTVTRNDDVAGRILVDLLRDFAEDRLTLTLEAEEAAGGLVAEFAGFPAESASRVALRGEGPLEDWALAFEARADQVFDADGAARIDAVGQIGGTADFSVRPGPALDPAIRTALSPEATLTVDVAENDDGLISIREGALRAADLDLAASGTFDRATLASDLALRFEAREGLSALVEGAAFQRFGFDGRVVGPPEDLTATGALSLAGLATAPADVGAADLTAELRVRAGDVELDAAGAVEGLRLDRIGPELIGRADLTIDGAFANDVVTLATLSLAATPLTIEASGQADLGAEAAALSYRLSAPALAPIAAAYDVVATGAFAASGAVDGPFAAPRLEGEASLSDLSFNEEPLGVVRLTHDATFGATPEGRVALAASGSRFGPASFEGGFRLVDARLTLSDLIARALGAVIAGGAEVDLETTLVDGALTLDAPDLTPLAALAEAAVGGAAVGELTFTSAGAAQNVGLDLSLDGVEAAEARLASATLRGDVGDALGEPRLNVALTFADAAAADARVAAGEAKIEGLLEDLGFELALRDVAAPSARLAEATATGRATALTSDDPGFDAALALRRIEAGGASIPRADLTAVGALSDFKVALRTGSVAAPGASIGEAALDAAVKGATAEDPAIDAALRIRDVALDGAEAEITTLGVNVAGALSALSLSLDAAGGVGDEPLTAALRASADLSGSPRAEIGRFDLAAGEATARLNAPLAITTEGGATRFRGLDLTAIDAALKGDAALHGDGLVGDLTLNAPDLATFADLLDLPLDRGGASISAVFDTRPGAAGGDIAIEARDLRFADVVADIGALALDGALRWDGRTANADIALSGPFARPFSVAAAFPLRPTGGPLPAAPPNGALTGSIDWTGEIEEIWALVPAPGHILAGETRVALTLGGSLSSPTVGGDVAINGGRYENLDIGAILVDLALSSRVAPDGAFVVDLSAEDGAGGPVSAAVAVGDGRVEAQISAEGATLVRRDDVTAAVTLDVRAAGPLAAPDIDGEIRIERAEVRLVAATPPGVADLGEVRIKGEEPPEPEPETGEEIDLNLSIVAPQDVFVRGRGLDSEWEIDLKVTGTASDPRIRGAIQKRRGILNFLGKEFDLDTGEIRFIGAKGIDPTLNVKLLRETDGFEGGIAVTGTAQAPDIAFTSTPALPEEEVLPRILFGRSSQSLSPTEALSLAIGLSTLLDGGGGGVDGVRGAVGLDVLRIDDEGDAGTSVTVGSNVADGVFVGAKQPLAGGAASVQVEVEVFDNVTIDSEFGQDIGTSIGLNWKKDF